MSTKTVSTEAPALLLSGRGNKPVHAVSLLPRSVQAIGWAIPFVAVALALAFGYWN